MSEWDELGCYCKHEHAVDFSEVPVRRLWLHLPNPRALVRGAPWSTAYDAGYCPCLFVYRDRLDKSYPQLSPLYSLPCLTIWENNWYCLLYCWRKIIHWSGEHQPMLSIVQVSTPFVRTTNSFLSRLSLNENEWVSEATLTQCEEPSAQCFPGWKVALPGADNSWLATEFVALTFLGLRSIFCGRRLLVRDRRGRCSGSHQPVSQPPIYLNAIGKQLPRGRGLPKRR